MKPTVSLIDGVVVGSGVGISLYGTHRVAGERYRFAMPETGIGLFPDVGVAWAFARLPDEIGMYLGLTGRSIGRADAYRLGLATHCIPGVPLRGGARRACRCRSRRRPARRPSRGPRPRGARALAQGHRPVLLRRQRGGHPRAPAIGDRRCRHMGANRASRSSRRALRPRSRSPIATSGPRARSTCAPRWRRISASAAGASRLTISTRACGRSSSTGTAPPNGSRQHWPRSARPWWSAISPPSDPTSSSFRAAPRCRASAVRRLHR